MIKFFNIDKIYENNKGEILDTFNNICSSGKLIQGKYTKLLEEVMTRLCNRKYAVAVNSCTDALYFALKSLEIGEGDEVIVTSFSFIASAEVIIRCGAIPVFVDIDVENFMMLEDEIENKITKNTKAILAVHIFGQMMNIEKINAIAKRHNLFVIEDAAQALGTKYKKIPAGKFGLISCISFDPTKIVGGFGSSGILLTDSIYIKNAVQEMRYHGKNYITNNFERLGYNSQMSEISAAMILLQLEKLNYIITQRNVIAQIYKNELNDIVKTPSINFYSNHNWHKFVIKVPCNLRNSLKEFLYKNNIETMIHYEKPLYKYGNIFKNRIVGKTDNVDKICKEVLSLPIYPELKTEEIYYITQKIKEFFE